MKLLKASALVIAGTWVWRSLQSAVKLLPPRVLQSGLSAISVTQTSYSTGWQTRTFCVTWSSLKDLCLFKRQAELVNETFNIKEDNVLLNDLCASNCLRELILFLYVHLLPRKRGRESVIPLWNYPHMWCILHILFSCQENSKLIGLTWFK